MECVYVHSVSIVITQCALMACTMLLIEFRYDFRKTLCFCIPWSLGIICSSLFILHMTDAGFYHRIIVFIVTLPYFILTTVIAKYRNISLFFTYITSCMIAVITLTNGYAAAAHFNITWFDTVARSITLAVAALICYLIRKRYKHLTRTLKQGWVLLYTVPFGICISFLMWFNNREESGLKGLWLPYSLFLLGIFVYAIIFLYFDTIMEKHELQYNNQMISLQMTTLKNQLLVQSEAYAKIQVLKHDMRFEMQTMVELFRTGKRDEAETMYEKWLDTVDNTGEILCAEPYLNAVLSIYKRRADNAGLTFLIDSGLPADVNLDTTKLSIILSNALDNAIIAANEVKENSYIKVKLIKKGPQVGIEVRNSCITPVTFDSDGHPITQTPGHGLGTVSILNYIKEYGENAVLNYSHKDDEFRMQILV